MYAEERQQAIADLVTKRGRLSVNDLADEYTVTTETVRRDLSVLERAGVLRRVHGGAVPSGSLAVLETAVGDRDQAHSDAKDAIAKAALAYLPDAGGTVLFDAGTTTGRMVTHLPRDHRIVAFTNAVPLASRLAGLSTVQLHLLPGRVRTTTQAAVGEDTVAALSRLRLDVAFIGTNGISLHHGLSTPDASEAAVKSAMTHCAQRVVVVVDSSKIGREHTVRFAELAEVGVVVTDSDLADKDAAALRKHDIELVIA